MKLLQNILKCAENTDINVRTMLPCEIRNFSLQSSRDSFRQGFPRFLHGSIECRAIWFSKTKFYIRGGYIDLSMPTGIYPNLDYHHYFTTVLVCIKNCNFSNLINNKLNIYTCRSIVSIYTRSSIYFNNCNSSIHIYYI